MLRKIVLPSAVLYNAVSDFIDRVRLFEEEGLETPDSRAVRDNRVPGMKCSNAGQ